MVQLAVELDDEPDTSFFFWAMSPKMASDGSARCGASSDYTVVLCRHIEDGTQIEVSRGPARSSLGAMPILMGRVSRPDGSSVLLQIHSRGAWEFSQSLAESLLSDPLIGWQTSAEFNTAGETLSDFHDLKAVVTRTQR